MDSQDVKGSETLFKSSLQYFSHIFWSLWNEITYKKIFLVVFQILRPFVKMLTPDNRCTYIQIKKNFPNFFLPFMNLLKNLITLKKKMSLGGYLFVNL